MFSGARKQMGPQRGSAPGPPLAAALRTTDLKTLLRRAPGIQGRRWEGAPCRRDLSCFSSSAREKKTMTHCLPTPAYLRQERRLTYGGAYAKLSSATSLIANHRVRTRLTFSLLPQPPLTPNLFSPFLNSFLFLFFK